LFEERERHGSFVISVTDGGLFFSDLGENFGVVGEELESEGDRGGHGICKSRRLFESVIVQIRIEEVLLTLRSENEREKNESHLLVIVLSNLSSVNFLDPLI
jgi:hypothetical protein